MFHPGETVIHRFIIPFAYREVKKVIVTYKQNNRIILVKELPEKGSTAFPTQELEAASETNFFKATAQFDVALTEEESLLFSDETKFTIQINVVTMSNTRAASHEIQSESGIQHYRELATPNILVGQNGVTTEGE